MKTQKQESLPEFDFKKPQALLAKIEKQSYKKLSFVLFGLSALLFGGYVAGNVTIDKITPEIAKASAISTTQEKLLIQQIQQMSEKEFINMLDYIATNVNMYDDKASFIQQILSSASAENMFTTITNKTAITLGEQISEYKFKVKEDVTVLNKVRLSIANNVEIASSDIQLFFSYMTAYRSKLVLSDADMDKKIYSLVFNVPSGNADYNKKNNVYEKIKEFDNKVENFKFVESSNK